MTTNILSTEFFMAGVEKISGKLVWVDYDASSGGYPYWSLTKPRSGKNNVTDLEIDRDIDEGMRDEVTSINFIRVITTYDIVHTIDVISSKRKQIEKEMQELQDMIAKKAKELQDLK